ncbi:hypothetical protein DM02DRAFT_519788 [Periconia macrospinosa]|uniref:F-box domain-containing protein n=1 Tax=Periconia macrospinosa TaxID=97972 RepID=A0A2V1E060_9PLEO|nr:hypothetical protein DM02DRAFT_519788 [Periconia macrospinosa]
MAAYYRSATEYRFSEEQTNDIIQATAYQRKGYPLCAIWFRPHDHVDIRQSIATSSERTSPDGFGSLDRLPPELLLEILFHLDMHSLFKFRQTNLRARQTINSLPQYRIVVSHGLNLLCATLRTRVATHISLLDIYSALCTKACSLCGEFGGFVFLLTWKRCCFKCIKEAPETKVQTLAAARRQFSLTEDEVGQVRTFKTLRGLHLKEQCVRKSRNAIVSVQQVRQVYEQRLSVKAGASQAQEISPEVYYILEFKTSCALPHYDRRTGNVEHAMSCAGCQLTLAKYSGSGSHEKWALDACNKMYSRDGFLEHFKWCAHAQLLWRSSENGSPQVVDME